MLCVLVSRNLREEHAIVKRIFKQDSEDRCIRKRLYETFKIENPTGEKDQHLV